MDQASAFSLSPSPLKIQAGTSFFPPLSSSSTTRLLQYNYVQF